MIPVIVSRYGEINSLLIYHQESIPWTQSLEIYTSWLSKMTAKLLLAASTYLLWYFWSSETTRATSLLNALHYPTTLYYFSRERNYLHTMFSICWCCVESVNVNNEGPVYTVVTEVIMLKLPKLKISYIPLRLQMGPIPLIKYVIPWD